MKKVAIWFGAVLVMGCGSSSGEKTQQDAGMPSSTDAGAGAAIECFVPDDCKPGEFCSAKQTCEPLMPVGGACGFGIECKAGLYCLRTYDKDGLCKMLPETCPKDICACYGQSTEPFCDGTPSNCDPTGQTIYCTKLR